MAFNELKFKVLKTENEITLREYPPLVVVETEINGDFVDVSDEGYRRLGDYLLGANKTSKKLTLTAPISLAIAPTEKIALLQPEETVKTSEGRWRISFNLPSGYTLQTLPYPDDSRVVFRDVPRQKMAALQYSGNWSKPRYEERKEKLLSWIKNNGLKPTGEVVFARYNQPWVLPFLRRNEVLIPVSPRVQLSAA
jgi:hypothetical protein